MLQQNRLMFAVKCPVPHDGFPLSRGAYDYNRNMTDRERVQSVQPGADMAVPLFFRVFGRGRLFLGGISIHLTPAAFRVRAKPNWLDFRWLRFQVATLKSSCIGLLPVDGKSIRFDESRSPRSFGK